MRFKLRAIMSALIVLPLIVVSVVGLVTVSRFSADYAERGQSASAEEQAEGVAEIVGELTAFLEVAAENSAVKAAVTKNPDARSHVNLFIADYIESRDGVYDIIIADDNGFVFTSYTGNYADTTPFRDDSETLGRIAASPTPVSGFYEGGRFYCIQPVRDGEISGFIILETEADLISDYIERTAFNESGIFTIYDDAANAEISDFHVGGIIAGTRWAWYYDYPASQANSLTFKVWITAFVVSAGISAINLTILLLLTKEGTFKKWLV
jgi:hypothetical protein